jgi:hypothetical protein
MIVDVVLHASDGVAAMNTILRSIAIPGDYDRDAHIGRQVP